jgi:hypothetical protein
MKFNKTIYYLPSDTKNNTNIKNYVKLKDSFSFYADFKLDNFVGNESCVIGWQGKNYMGIFLQKPNIVKFSWHKDGGIFTDILTTVDDIYKPLKILATISNEVNLYVDGEHIGTKERGKIDDRLHKNKNIVIGAINPYFKIWECRFEGEINEIKIFDDVVITPDDNENIYAHYNFENQSKFKTFDISGNGNHAILFEDPAYRKYTIDEYVKNGPKQTIK